ncbi:MAG: hypothetical protein FVQ84_00385 [Planctomycetes bacterium]|nr:hypothetical protein [Planctomycetota bacterium]
MGRSLNQAAKYVLESIESLGLQITIESRLDAMCKSLQNPDGSWRDFIGVNDHDFNFAREALRDLTLLEFFFDQIGPEIETEQIKQQVKQSLRDSVLPQHDMPDSPGRDTQAELFVFAVCKKGDLHPKFKEPDVVCEVCDEEFAIAVKRIKNLDKLVRRVRDGASQIQNSSLPGIVVVEITRAVNPQNLEIALPGDDSSFGKLWEATLKEIIDHKYNQLTNAVNGKGVIGIILHDHQIRIIDSDGKRRLETMTYRVSMCEGSINEKLKLDQFTRRYIGAIPNLMML